VAAPIRAEAVRIVLLEERARGWQPKEIGIATEEKRLGCDLLSIPPEGGDPHPVEVKGWGEAFLSLSSGRFVYDQDIRASQMEAAKRNPNYRLEIVANLTAYLAGTGPYERLTLTAAEICERAVPRLYDVPLSGMEEGIRRETADPPAVAVQ
jgi:hypothetical protein